MCQEPLKPSFFRSRRAGIMFLNKLRKTMILFSKLIRQRLFFIRLKTYFC